MFTRLFWALVLLSTAPPVLLAQPVLGQLDTFQDGTLNNWTNGAAAGDPVNIPNGGPLGAGDRYMQVSSGAFGGGTRIAVFNITQWTGNYLSAGVTTIEMDLLNNSGVTMFMRWGMRTESSFPSTPGYVSTVPFTLPADNNWHHAVFQLNAASLTAVNNPPPLDEFLPSVGEARMLHSANPALVGDFGNWRFGVDNILAAGAAVPEPFSWLLLGLAASCVGAFWRRHAHTPNVETTAEDLVPQVTGTPVTCA